METCRSFSFQRLALLGAEVDVATPAEVLEFVAACVGSDRPTIIANHNLHSLHLYARDPEVRAFYARADLIEIDSTPLIAWGRLMGLDLSRAHRSTYLDYREDFWSMVTARNLKVFHLGGAPGVGEAARDAILTRWPTAKIEVGDGYFDVNGQENDILVAGIAARRPDILLVGMGMPRQELWIAANADRMPPCVILPIGGAFDYEAGVQYMPPRWTGQLGLEWLARFAGDPGRLFHRYFVEPWSLLPQILGDIAWSLSRRTRLVERVVADDAKPWLRRQAFSTHAASGDAIPVAIPEARPASSEHAPEPLRAAN